MTTDEQPERKDSVTTGVLDAERRARDIQTRRRRMLVGGAALGLLIAGAVLSVMTFLQQQANRDAELRADRIEARAEFAEAIVVQAEDYELPATAIRRDAPDLRTVLEEFVTATVVSDSELTRRVEVLLIRLEQEAATVGDLTDRAVPEPGALVGTNQAVEVLRELETLRAEATALAAEVPLAANDVRTWSGVVRDVNDAVAAHIEQVESEEPTSNPRELIELWRAERPALLRLSAAATAADDVEGLETWAGAHHDYARSLLDWIEEAVELLQADEFDAYNERFEEVFATEDPFGFNAAVAATTDDALSSPALLQLGTVEQRAQLVLDGVTTTEVVTAQQLSIDELPA